MKRLFTFFALLFTVGAISAQSCEYTLNMFDSWGDGWNGASVSISVNGVAIGDATFNTGTEATYTFEINDGDEVSMSFNSGSYDEEVSFDLIDIFGGLVNSWVGPTPFGSEVYTTNLNCPTCPETFDNSIVTSDVRSYSARLDWVAYPASLTSVTSYLVEYGDVGFALGTGTQVDAGVTGGVTLTNLMAEQGYDVYLGIVCDGGEIFAEVPVSFTTLSPIDVGVAEILSPLSGCSVEGGAIEVLMANYGGTPQTLIPFNFMVNSVLGNVNQPVDGFYTGVIDASSQVTTSFDVTFDHGPGTYEIVIWTDLDGDTDSSNDTTTITINTEPSSILSTDYFQNFESPSISNPEWNFTAEVDTISTMVLGTPLDTVDVRDLNNTIIGTTVFETNDGGLSWVTNPTGDYIGDELSYITSSCLDFTNVEEDPLLSFSLFVNTEINYDGFWVETSVDGGATWQLLGVVDDPEGVNWYNNQSFNGSIWWSGQYEELSQWRTVSHPLTDLAGRAAQVRFVFRSDGIIHAGGIAFDDINITYCPAEFTFDEEITDLSSADAQDGAITINPTIGQAPFTYEWSTGDTGNSVDNLGAGEYTVIVTDANGCSASSTFEINYVVSSDDATQVVNAFEVYPNPTKDIASIDLSLVEATSVQLEVHNLLGEVILSTDLGTNTEINTTIDLTNQAAGVYFVKAFVGEQVITKKVIKAN